MESLNVVPSSKENNRYQSQDQINSPQLPHNILDLEEPQHARSFCEYARSDSLQKYPNMVESPDVIKKASDKQLPIGKSPRISLKLEQINKIDHQEFEPEMSAKLKRPIFEFYKPKEAAQKKEKKEKKKAVQDENKNPKDTKETKKSGFGSYGMKILKSTFRSEKKRGSSGSDANRRKSLDEVGTNEVDERDQQKIGQVSRPQLNLKPVSSLGEHIQPEIAQEENPLSSGHLRLSLGDNVKMKKGSVDFKAKTVDDGELRAAETIQSINLEEKLSYGKKRSLDAKTAWSSVDFTRDEKTDTRATLEIAKPKVSTHSYSGIMKFGTLVDRIAKKRHHFGTILMPKKRNTWEKVLEYGMLALIFAFIFYCVLPFAVLFTAHDYDRKYVRTYFNFGFLGFLQGVVEISLIYCVADRPILRRIKEIEGENEGLIDSNIYRLLPPFKAVLLLLSKIGAQIISGVVINGLGYDVQTANILVGTISNIAITVVFWFLFLLLQNPTRKENRKQILSKELRQIGDIRKDFIENLQKTKRELDNKVDDYKFDIEEQEKLGGKQESRVCHMGIVAGITSGVKVEVRKFYCDVSEYSAEFIRLRLKVLRAYAALLLSVLQLFALLSILKVINDNDSLFISLPLVVSLLVVGTLFGYIDFFNSPDRPIMTTNRIINMLITIGAYRFFYLTVSNKWAMIGAVILKFGYKFVAYYMFILTNSHLTKYWSEIVKKRVLRKEVKPANYIMREEKELAIVTPLRYIFQKFIVLQNFDLYFGLGTLILLCTSRFWLPDLEFGLNLRIEDFNFYIGLALLEAALDVLVWMNFTSLAKGIIRKHTSLIDSSNTLEMKDIMENRGLIIIAFKAFILFVYLFIFMNKL